MSPRTCRSCGHSTWQHPDGGPCRLHPRGEDRCTCEAFAGPPTATSGNSQAGLASIRAGYAAAGLSAAARHEAAMDDLRAIIEAGGPDRG